MEIQSKAQTTINEPINKNDKDIPFRQKIIEYNNKKKFTKESNLKYKLDYKYGSKYEIFTFFIDNKDYIISPDNKGHLNIFDFFENKLIK